MSSSDSIELGRRYVQSNKIHTGLHIGFGATREDLNFDPWGEDCMVAAIGFTAAGGPIVLAGASPILGTQDADGNIERRWYPLIDCGDNFEYRGRKTPCFDIVAAISTRQITLPGSVFLPRASEIFYQWIGFLLQLKKASDGYQPALACTN